MNMNTTVAERWMGTGRLHCVEEEEKIHALREILRWGFRLAAEVDDDDEVCRNEGRREEMVEDNIYN